MLLVISVNVSLNDFLFWLCVILAGNEDMILLEKDMRPRWNSLNKTLSSLKTIFINSNFQLYSRSY